MTKYEKISLIILVLIFISLVILNYNVYRFLVDILAYVGSIALHG